MMGITELSSQAATAVIILAWTIRELVAYKAKNRRNGKNGLDAKLCAERGERIAVVETHIPAITHSLDEIKTDLREIKAKV